MAANPSVELYSLGAIDLAAAPRNFPVPLEAFLAGKRYDCVAGTIIDG